MALKKMTEEEMQAAAGQQSEPVPEPDAALVKMLKYDASMGEHDKIEVHPTCVKAHQEAGWLIDRS